MENISSNHRLNNIKPENLDWTLVQPEMKKRLGNEIYESWLKKIEFIEEFNNYILLSVPTRFIRDWITSRYLDQILQIIKVFKKDLVRIEFKIIEQNTKNDLKKKNFVYQENVENVSFIKDSYLQYNRVDPNKRFENFIRSSSNKLAFEASTKIIFLSQLS